MILRNVSQLVQFTLFVIDDWKIMTHKRWWLIVFTFHFFSFSSFSVFSSSKVSQVWETFFLYKDPLMKISMAKALCPIFSLFFNSTNISTNILYVQNKYNFELILFYAKCENFDPGAASRFAAKNHFSSFLFPKSTEHHKRIRSYTRFHLFHLSLFILLVLKLKLYLIDWGPIKLTLCVRPVCLSSLERPNRINL